MKINFLTRNWQHGKRVYLLVTAIDWSSMHWNACQNQMILFINPDLRSVSCLWWIYKKNIARVRNSPDVAILNSLFGLCLLSFCLFCLFVFLYLCLYVFMSLCLFVFLSFYLFVFSPFCLFVFLFFVFLSFCLFVFLPFCIFVFLSFCSFVFFLLV